jgi:hypothetical protein
MSHRPDAPRARGCARLRRHAVALLTLLTLAPYANARAQSEPPSTTSREPRLATPSAVARDARSIARRIGLWASAGAGRASAGLSCAACRDETTPAVMLHLAVGGRVHSRFHVGVETWSWLDVIGNGVDRTARGTQLIARHYPLADKRVFITGGVGTSRFRVDDGNTRFAASSPALSLGLGWDVPFRGVVLSPTLHLVSSTGGALTSDRTGNSVADNARLGLWRSTIAITWF